MMANKQSAAFASDDEGQDYDPAYNYGSSSDYEEDKHHHTQKAQAPGASKTAPRPTSSSAHQQQHDYSDDNDEDDDYYRNQQQQQHVRQQQVVSPSSVALPTSPVSTRGAAGGYDYDSYSDRRDSYPAPSPLIGSVAATAATTTSTPAPISASATAGPVASSRNSWEEDDSEEEPYPADAYDYGQESSSESEDEYEERPRSEVQKKSEELHEQQQPPQSSHHGESDRSDSENEFEERPRSHLQHQQQPHQQQQPTQGHNYAADSSHSEDEYEERPRSHIQQQSQLPSNQYHADSQSEDEYEERPRSHLQQQQQQFHGYSDRSDSENEHEERPRSHLQQQQQQQRHSIQSDSSHTEIVQVVQKEKNPYNYDSDSSRSSSEDHRPQQSAPIPAVVPAPVAAPVHQEDKQHSGRYSTESLDRRSSFEEDTQVAPAVAQAPIHYGSDSDSSDDDYAHTKAAAAVHQQEQPKEAFYGDVSEEPVANNNLFQSSALDPRASVNSAKSYSSHTKHHSFGYDERPAEHDAVSDSESGSSSESEPEKKNNMLKELSSTLMSAVPMSPPVQAPPVPNKSRPTSTFSLASHNSIASPRSPTFARAMGSPIAERWEQPAPVARAPESPVMSASAPVVAAAAVAATAAVAAAVATAATVSSPATPTPATLATPAPAPVSPPVQDTTPLAVDTVSQKSASSASSLDQRQKNNGYDSDTSGTSIDLHSPTFKNRSNMTPPSVFTRTFSSSSGVKEKAPASPERTRPISYATVFSDADMNDVNLMDEPLASEQRASVVVPRTPVTPSAFGFTSNFFGGGAARSQPTPPPPSSQPQQVPLPATPVQAAPSTPTLPTPPKANDTRSRSTSISAFASSIQGAFSRGFSSQSQPPVPPLPTRTPSQISQRTSNAPAPSTFAAFGQQQQQQQQQQDPRNSVTNRSMTSARASTISNATNDSNMDMLLARLEAQNELLAQESSKRRTTTESDMDRALSHAKEESAGDDVDWDYWGALMHDYNGVVKRNPRQLTTMIQRGVPSALRGLIWQLLAKSKDPQLESTFAELLKSTSTHEKQITRDMTRTFPSHEYFQAEGSVGQEALFNVAKAYSLYDPEVGYCQGISFIVGPLLLNMPEEEAFCMLVRMMQTYEMRGHYTPDMEKLQLRLYQFEQLMEETVPMIFKHLRNQGIRSTMYASQWFMTVFAYKFPLELVFRVYDILFVEGADALLRFAVALLVKNHDRILSLDFEVLIEFLKHGLFEPYMNDAGLFIQDAYNVKVTPKKLTQYAQKYQAMIQKQQAEMAAEENLRESNKQLSGQVRNLEGSLHQLNKEHVDLAKELITRKMEMAQLSDRNDVLEQKVSDLTRIVDSQGKEVEEQYKGEIEDVLRKNMEIQKKNEQLEDQLAYMESLLVETKMKYAESEIERDSLSRKLSDMRKTLTAM